MARKKTKTKKKKTRTTGRKVSRSPGRGGIRRRGFAWESHKDEELLDLRLCDLKVKLEGSWLEKCVHRLHDELDQKGIRCRPHVWLSDDWFSPVGVTGFAIPFYLTHPRLMRLEKKQILEIEGGTRDECMKIMRHEAGHVIQDAFRINRRRRFQELFGRSTTPYPDSYRPNPSSKRYVYHLDAWYAQSHPDEDFAETFAVWLRPRSGWRKRYRHWRALEKLAWVDEVMKEIAGTRPKLLRRDTSRPLSRLRVSLRKYYEKKKERFEVAQISEYDGDLLRLFGDPSKKGRSRGETAKSFVRSHREEIRELVSRWTGEAQFTLDQVLKDMIKRCQKLGLRASGPESRLKLDLAILVTMHTMRCHRARHWRAV